jgi:hypothetical protein
MLVETCFDPGVPGRIFPLDKAAILPHSLNCADFLDRYLESGEHVPRIGISHFTRNMH